MLATIAVAWYHASCDTRSMFTVAQRTRIRDGLVRAASEDESITAAAFVGSAAIDREDRWSDIDLALRIRPDLEPEPVAQHWTERMYADHGAVHHLDVWAGPALYRVFLLSNTLQVDLSFWPSRAFAASGPSFRLLFGETNDAPMSSSPPSTEALAGMGWLYALHVRSSLARGRRWQAVHMLDGLREQVVALACHRFGLSAHQGRGVGDLPLKRPILSPTRWSSLWNRPISIGPSRARHAYSSKRRATSMPGWPPGWRGRSKSWSAPATSRRNVRAVSETETGGHKVNRKSRFRQP